MKNYEEMAQSVLKRRDIEIKRRRRAFLIGAPCAAAVLVGVAGIGTVVASQSRSKHINATVDFTPGAAEVNSSAEIADIAFAPAEPPDYTNPNAGKVNVPITYAENLYLDNGANVDGCDFTEYTLEELDRYYGLRFNRFAALYPEWELSYGKLGIYTKDYTENKGGLDVAVHELTSTRNTLVYTTKNGGKVAVIAQHGSFEPLTKNFTGSEENTSVSLSEPEIHTEYDENGNVIGQTVAGYDPAASRPAEEAPERVNCYSEDSTGNLNGYKAVAFGQLNNFKVTGVDFYVADIDMASNVRIIAEGLSDKEFLDILDNYTNNVEEPIITSFNSADEPIATTNTNAVQNDINVLDLNEFNILDNSPDLSGYTFEEHTLDELDDMYHMRFNILSELHPDWELSYDKLGTYTKEHHLPDSFIVKDIVSDLNTLNYTTPGGAKITVSAACRSFLPISDEKLTRLKPEDPSKYTHETAYADDGTPIGIISHPIDPNDCDPEPDEGVSTVNGCEALIYRNAEGDFLSDIDINLPTDPGASFVRITAEGLSEDEFLEVLDEFTKLKKH